MRSNKEINIIALELVYGGNVEYHYSGGRLFIGSTTETFDIFNDERDCLTTVKKIGEDYNLVIVCEKRPDETASWHFEGPDVIGNVSTTYENAVADALLSL